MGSITTEKRAISREFTAQCFDYTALPEILKELQN